MGLFDIFSGDSGQAAAAKSKKAMNKKLKKAKKEVKKDYGQAREEYAKGTHIARGDITGGKTEGLGYLDTGTQKAADELAKAQGYYQPIADIANPALQRYDQFFGGGGAEGAQAAQQNWEMSPYYQAMTDLNQLGIQGLDRQAAARGNPYNFTDQANYLQAQAGQWLPQYTQDLWRVAGLAPEIAGAQAGLGRDTAKLYEAQGINKSNVATDAAKQLSGAQMWGSGNAGQSYMNQGNQLSNLYGQMGQNNANYYQNAYGADQAANQNLWNGILGVAGLGTKLVTGLV